MRRDTLWGGHGLVMRTVSIAVSLALIPAALAAQPATPPSQPQASSPLALEIRRFAAASGADLGDAGEIRDNFWKVVYLKAGHAKADEILATRRADIQSGSGAGASGTTSAVSSPLLPAIFGIALEQGAITRTISGTTITIKAVPAQLVCASRPDRAAAVARRDDDACRTFWRRIGVTASFDTSRGEKTAQLTTLESLDNQFSDVALRAEVLNRRKASGRRFRQAFTQEYARWEQLAQALVNTGRETPAITEAATALTNRLAQLTKEPTWATKSVQARSTDVDAAIRAAAVAVRVPDEDAERVLNAWASVLRANGELQLAIANAPVVTAEYRFQQADVAAQAIGTIITAGARPPSVHTTRLIYAQGFPGTNLDLTANLSSSWFDSTRTGMTGRFREAQIGLEGKFKLRDLAGYGAPALSFAGVYMFLNQEPLGLGLVAFNSAQITERGHIGVFQTKLEFPTANNTIRIPLSFTYSNRTELVKESNVRGQLGISFNMDSLFASAR